MKLEKENKKIVITETPVEVKSNQIAITLMTTFNNTFHWVARSSDNTYFDSLRNFYPGNQCGRVGVLWPSRPYTDAGMTILLTNKG